MKKTLKKINLVWKKVEKPAKIAGKILEWGVFAVLVLIFTVVLSPLLPTKKYVSTYIVSSGSMEPTIKTGSIAFIQPIKADQVKEGDIVTFTQPTDSTKIILHRIFKAENQNGNLSFQTKGDYNNGPDMWNVPSTLMQGKYIAAVPYLGYPAMLMKTPKGFAIIVGIPALLLLFLQIKKIKEGIEEEVQKRTERALKKAKPVKTDLLSILMAVTLLSILTGYSSMKSVSALFVSKVMVSGVSISVKDFVPPPVPALLLPENNSSRNTNGMVMDWTDVSDYKDMHNPVYYIYQSAYDPDFKSVAYTSAHLAVSQIPAPGTPNGIYYWHVKACDSIDNCSAWSDAWKVTVDNTPAPSLTPTATPSATPTPTPSPTPSPSPSVVINEVMWMGSTKSVADEWLELRNMTDHEIDLSSWQIENAVSGEGGHLEIPAHKVIPANGYFLISNYEDDETHSALNGSLHIDYQTTSINFENDYRENGALILKDKDKNVIDSTPDPVSGNWPVGNDAGSTGLHQSMERNNIPGDGRLVSSWHACTDSACQSTDYWTVSGDNYGTPRALNHSDNDPSTTPTPTPTPTPAPTPTPTPSTTINPVPESSPSANLGSSSEPEPEASLSPAPSSAPEPSMTPVPSASPSPTPSAEPASSPEPSPTPSPSPVTGSVSTPEPSPSATPAPKRK